MRRRRRDTRERRRGTASVEVIMMLPFFLIVFAGVYFMHGLYMSRQQAALRARSCTWAYAADGCRNQKRLRECLKTPEGDKPADHPDEMKPPPPDRVQPEVGNGEGPKFLSQLSGAPVIGIALQWLFGVPVATVAMQPIHHRHNPTLRASDPEKRLSSDMVIQGEYFTMCNTVPRRWGTVAVDVFCGVVGKDFPGCDD